MPRIVALAAAVVLSGCAFHYHDARTGIDHLWGVGHLAVRATPADGGLKAVVRGADTVGLSVGRANGEVHVTLGWFRRRHVEVVDENAAVRLSWPGDDLLRIRVGSAWPHDGGPDGLDPGTGGD